MHETEKHILAYFILIVGLGLIFGIYAFAHVNTTTRLLLGFSGVVFYMLWGIGHHLLEGRFHKEVLLEYLLVGIFVFSLIMFSTL
jgi:hypothetical protein